MSLDQRLCAAPNRARGDWQSILAAILKPKPLTFDPTTWRFTMNSPTVKTTIPSNSLSVQLQQIGLRALPTQLDDFLAHAAKARWSPHQILEQLVQAEVAERSR